MAKSVLRFSLIRLALSVVNFFTLGALISFFLTEGEVHTAGIAVYMVLNILIFSLVWVLTLNIPPREAGKSNRSDLLTLHIPTLIYFGLTLVLLAADLLFGAAESEAGGYALVMLRYLYLSVCPLGINTLLVSYLDDFAGSFAYYVSVILHLMLYAGVITAACKSARK